MTWRPTPQPPCTCPSCYVPETGTRKCTEKDPCSFCGPVKRFWSLDPSPVAEPPDPGERTRRAVTGNIPGRGIEVTIISTPPSPGDFLRRRFNATRRNT